MFIVIVFNDSEIGNTMGIQRGYDGDMVNKYRYGMCIYIYISVSENSVPLNPMVLLIIIPIKWLFHWEY